MKISPRPSSKALQNPVHALLQKAVLHLLASCRTACLNPSLPNNKQGFTRPTATTCGTMQKKQNGRYRTRTCDLTRVKRAL